MSSAEAAVVEGANTDARQVLDSILSEGDGARVVEPAAAEYRVSTSIFEGPLDLLLHLIRKEQIDVHDIPIAKICKKYLEHLEIIQQFDVNLAGEFMVMAATLTFLKSQVLIPKEENEDAEEEDPRLPLVNQLLEYERFKEAAQKLDARLWMYRDIYPRPAGAVKDFVPKHTPTEAPVEPIDTYEMLVCLKTATDRTTKIPIQIHSQSASLKDRVVAMSSELAKKDVVEFANLVPAERYREELVVSFLAILELARMSFIQIMQTETFGPIHLRLIDDLKNLDTGLLQQF